MDKATLITNLQAKYGNQISRAQLIDYCETSRVPYPQWLVNHNAAKAGRGVYDLTKLGFGAPIAKIEEKPVDPTEVAKRIQERIDVIRIMVDATVDGKNRAMLVSGPAGVGKTYEVINRLGPKEFEHIKGFVRPTGLYKALWENRHKTSLIVFDDADSIFMDDICLNLLKAACDSTKRRTISWRAETRMEDEFGEKMPKSFEFEGAIIFITNYDFDAMIQRGNRLAPHFEALISRSHYVDMGIKTKQDYLIRIRQALADGLLATEGLGQNDQRTIFAFVEQNADRLRELSLRMVLKLGGLMNMNRDGWQKIARTTCMKG